MVEAPTHAVVANTNPCWGGLDPAADAEAREGRVVLNIVPRVLLNQFVLVASPWGTYDAGEGVPCEN